MPNCRPRLFRVRRRGHDRLTAAPDGGRRGREAAERAERVRYLLVDIYRAVSGRLGLADWQRQIDSKLRSVSEIYRVFQDQAQHARSEFLELIIIALIAVKTIIGVLALHH